MRKKLGEFLDTVSPTFILKSMSLAQYIKQDLKARLESGRQLPPSLTLESLAAHYDVSFTPVRTAVIELVEEGWLKKGTNRRLSPAKGKLNSNNGSTARIPLPDPPRDLLKIVGDDLVRISLGGQSAYLREEAAAREYGVSRSAIRNIFHRLAGVGLLNHIPRRGWQVQPFRKEDMVAFLVVRETLELKALELAEPRLDDDDLRRMREANVDPDDDDSWPQVDHSLHAYFIEKACNPYIEDFLERHGRYYNLLFDWEDRDRQTALDTVQRHKTILNALLERNLAVAREALSRDIQCNHEKLDELADRAMAPPADGTIHSKQLN